MKPMLAIAPCVLLGAVLASLALSQDRAATGSRPHAYRGVLQTLIGQKVTVLTWSQTMHLQVGGSDPKYTLDRVGDDYVLLTRSSKGKVFETYYPLSVVSVGRSK